MFKKKKSCYLAIIQIRVSQELACDVNISEKEKIFGK